MDWISERKKIENKVYEKLKEIEKLESKDEEALKLERKYKSLYKLITNPYEFLFEDIDMELSIAILMDLGMTRSEAFKSYSKLLKENINQKYILINENKNEEER